MRVCVAQIGFISESAEAHIRRIKDIILAHRSDHLIVFPELILHGHPSVDRPEGFLHRRVKAFYRKPSRDLDLFRFIREVEARVILGDLRRRGEKYYNIATYVDRERVEIYAKAHIHWTENFLPGRELKVFDTPIGRIGISICFDAAFPEVMRVQALKGADILVNIAAVPSSFPVKYMWRRHQANALNNQAFLIYCNRPGAKFSGFSAVFNPRGDVVAHAMVEEEILQTTIDLSEVEEWRVQEPIFPNMRPLLYRQITRARDPFLEEKVARRVGAFRRRTARN